MAVPRGHGRETDRQGGADGGKQMRSGQERGLLTLPSVRREEVSEVDGFTEHTLCWRVKALRWRQGLTGHVDPASPLRGATRGPRRLCGSNSG